MLARIGLVRPPWIDFVRITGTVARGVKSQHSPSRCAASPSECWSLSFRSDLWMARFSRRFSCGEHFGGAISGLAGFAMGLVVSGFYLHILTPVQTAALIVGYGLVRRATASGRCGTRCGWPKRDALHRRRRDRRAGRRDAAQLTSIRRIMRIGVGAAAGGLQHLQPGAAEHQADGRRDSGRSRHRCLNGCSAGLTGLVGSFVTIWCQCAAGRKMSSAPSSSRCCWPTIALTARYR